mmetsp:Transcript_9634/g.34202  ORF Transcript_9634/g.34202 Transcript_9634/m.34202 type:complete len:254 (+) Transcript_9634:849-1610(+)
MWIPWEGVRLRTTTRDVRCTPIQRGNILQRQANGTRGVEPCGRVRRKAKRCKVHILRFCRRLEQHGTQRRRSARSNEHILGQCTCVLQQLGGHLACQSGNGIGALRASVVVQRGEDCFHQQHAVFQTNGELSTCLRVGSHQNVRGAERGSAEGGCRKGGVRGPHGSGSRRLAENPAMRTGSARSWWREAARSVCLASGRRSFSACGSGTRCRLERYEALQCVLLQIDRERERIKCASIPCRIIYTFFSQSYPL